MTYESIRKWDKKFAQPDANQIRRHCPQSSDTWHLDKVVITKVQQYYLWRAVDAAAQVLDILMQRHRDKRIAETFFRKLLRLVGCCCYGRVDQSGWSEDAVRALYREFEAA